MLISRQIADGSETLPPATKSKQRQPSKVKYGVFIMETECSVVILKKVVKTLKNLKLKSVNLLIKYVPIHTVVPTGVFH